MQTKLLSLALILMATFGLAACSDDKDEPATPTTIELSHSQLTLKTGETARLTATVENAGDGVILTWKSADETIATIDQNGEVTAVNAGTTTVTAELNGTTANCLVTVVNPPSINLSQTSLTLEAGESFKLTATTENAGNTAIEWKSSDESVAIVDQEGLVTAIKAGSASITAECEGASASCEVTVALPAPQTGDYYYSDGTWSTEIDNNKSIIGIVFWTGDPTADDATLRADHPECTHGLVIGLDEAQMAWHPAYESAGSTVSEWVASNTTGFSLPRSGYADNDPLNNILGYNNTKAIEAYNNAAENSATPVAPVKWAVEYRSEVPAPLTSSDWYIPSPKELSLLCAGEIDGSIYIKKPIMTNANLINARLDAIGQMQMSDVTYWSSTENYSEAVPFLNETAWNYYFKELNRPLSWSIKSWDEYARVRCILAF